MSFLSKLKTYFSKEDNKREINPPIPEKPAPSAEKYESWNWNEKDKPNSINTNIIKILEYALEHLEDKNVVSDIKYYEHSSCIDILDERHKEAPSWPHTICLSILPKQTEKEKKHIEKQVEEFNEVKSICQYTKEEDVRNREQYVDKIYEFYITKNKVKEYLDPVLTYLRTIDYGENRFERDRESFCFNPPTHHSRWINIKLPHKFFDAPLALLRERERIEKEREKSYMPDKIKETLIDIIPDEEI